MIVEVRTHRVSARLHTPFVTALRSTRTVETVVVEIIDANGNRGFGEAPQVWQVTGESLAGSQGCIDGPLAGVVKGRDADDLVPLLRDVSRTVAANVGAKAAMDVALHDLVAHRRGVSLPILLGADNHRVPTDVTLSVGAIADLGPAAQARVAEGFGVLKLKVGTDATADIARVRVARDAVGPDTKIRLDANQGWGARQAVNAILAMEDDGLDLELVEQPVAARDIAGLAWVTDHVRTPIMADESVFGVRDLTEVIARRAADMVNVKIAKCGGLLPARTLLDLAAAHEMGTIVGSMMETHVGVGAAASLVAVYGTTATSDLDAAWWAEESPYDGGMNYDGATVVLPQSAGLGIAGIRKEVRR